jgi:hypothetical protein
MRPPVDANLDGIRTAVTAQRVAEDAKAGPLHWRNRFITSHACTAIQYMRIFSITTALDRLVPACGLCRNPPTNETLSSGHAYGNVVCSPAHSLEAFPAHSHEEQNGASA